MRVLGDSGNYKDAPNLYYNDAGQFISILTNGTNPGLIANGNKAGLSVQLAAFVDVVGPSTAAFSEDSVLFFG